MRKLPNILSGVVLLVFPCFCFSADPTVDAILFMQVSMVAILTSVFWYVVGVGTTLVAIFYAERILKQLKILFSPPPPPPG